MKKTTLTVIEGGLSPYLKNTPKEFAGAYITNTRLMGVMGMYVHWKLPHYPSCPDFHQFFYFDAEEYGFESYRSVIGNRVEEIAAIEQTMINGLGGKKNELTEREVLAILWKYLLFNKEHNIPMPEGLEEYEFMLDTPTYLSDEEKQLLINKVCDPIASEFHVLNYFLMRCFGHDYEAASWLCNPDVPLKLYEHQYPQATFCKNTIDADPEATGAYLCESLIEYNGQYQLLISRLTVDETLNVSSFEACSGFPISSAEAAMMLAKPEFITVYEVLITTDEFATLLGQVPLNCLITPHQNGKLYMMFHNHNDHVNKQVFMLSADVAGIYYLTDSGQLLAAAYDITSIHALEKDLRKSVLSPYMVATGKFEFKDPVLYEFVESQFDDFNDFLDFLQV